MPGVTAETKLSHPKVVARAAGGSFKPRMVFRILGVEHMWAVHNNDLSTLRRGVLTRIMYVKGQDGGWVPPPQPRPGVFRRLRRTAKQLVREVGATTLMSYEEFPTHYHGRKRTIYEQAVQSVLSSPVTKRDARLKAFIKFERLNFLLKRDPDPRVINPRGPRYNVAVGRYIKNLEAPIYQAIDRLFKELGCTNRTVAKGRNFEQRAWLLRCKWNNYLDPVALDLDCSRFDQHVRRDALRFEHGVYNGICRAAELRRLLSYQLKNTGLGRARDGTLRFEIDGMRASGDMNTALGNVVLVCLPLLELRETSGILFDVADDGDDCVIICERKDAARLSALLVDLFDSMGHELKISEPIVVFEQIKFCQTQPVFDGTKWTMVRDVHTAIAKDLTTTHDLRDSETYRWYVGTIGEAGQHLAGGIPVWDAFYRRLHHLGGGAGDLHTDDPGMESGFMINARKQDRTGTPITVEARVSFWRAFGIQPCHQEALEAEFGSMFEHGHARLGLLFEAGLTV